ncbi:MAG: hypothetical protein ACFFD1_12660 [Candidatus Thorarchaeota archaeon]
MNNEYETINESKSDLNNILAPLQSLRSNLITKIIRQNYVYITLLILISIIQFMKTNSSVSKYLDYLTFLIIFAFIIDSISKLADKYLFSSIKK